MNYIQELSYNKKSVTKVSVTYEWERAYTNDDYAIDLVKNYLGYISKKDTKIKAKGEFMQVVNENGELVKAIMLYEGKVEIVNVYTIEDFEKFIVEMNEYNVNDLEADRSIDY